MLNSTTSSNSILTKLKEEDKRMNKKINYIIREVPPESTDFSFYFDDDGLTEAGGDYCCNLFIVPTYHNSGFNGEEYKRNQDKADAIIDGFNDVSNKWTNGYDSYETYKECMENNEIKYTSSKCHALKEWVKTADTSEPKTIADFLTIITGKKWSVGNATGYSQGDYVEMVYCTEHYKDGVKNYGEIWLGAGKEFCVIDLDENGNEIDSCYGYIIADCQAWRDEEYKKLVCEWAGIPEDETQLEMIDGSKTYIKYSYRTL